MLQDCKSHAQEAARSTPNCAFAVCAEILGDELGTSKNINNIIASEFESFRSVLNIRLSKFENVQSDARPVANKHPKHIVTSSRSWSCRS